jgi:hypothetical protein
MTSQPSEELYQRGKWYMGKSTNLRQFRNYSGKDAEKGGKR